MKIATIDQWVFEIAHLFVSLSIRMSPSLHYHILTSVVFCCVLLCFCSLFVTR